MSAVAEDLELVRTERRRLEQAPVLDREEALDLVAAREREQHLVRQVEEQQQRRQARERDASLKKAHERYEALVAEVAELQQRGYGLLKEVVEVSQKATSLREQARIARSGIESLGGRVLVPVPEPLNLPKQLPHTPMRIGNTPRPVAPTPEEYQPQPDPRRPETWKDGKRPRPVKRLEVHHGADI